MRALVLQQPLIILEGGLSTNPNAPQGATVGTARPTTGSWSWFEPQWLHVHFCCCALEQTSLLMHCTATHQLLLQRPLPIPSLPTLYRNPSPSSYHPPQQHCQLCSPAYPSKAAGLPGLGCRKGVRGRREWGVRQKGEENGGGQVGGVTTQAKSLGGN